VAREEEPEPNTAEPVAGHEQPAASAPEGEETHADTTAEQPAPEETPPAEAAASGPADSEPPVDPPRDAGTGEAERPEEIVVSHKVAQTKYGTTTTTVSIVPRPGERIVDLQGRRATIELGGDGPPVTYINANKANFVTRRSDSQPQEPQTQESQAHEGQDPQEQVKDTLAQRFMRRIRRGE
jgi:hypothetical protein